MKSLVLLFLLSLAGCGSSLTRQEYMQMVRNSGDYVKSRQSEALVYTSFYKPIEYIILAENVGMEMSKGDFDRQKEQLKGLHYFDFRISFIDAGSNKPFKMNMNELNDYLAYRAEKDFSVKTASGHYYPVQYHFEKGSSGDFRFTMFFDIPGRDEEEELTFEFDDKISGYGIVKFNYKNKVIKHRTNILFN